MSFLQFFNTDNLITGEMHEACPWDFKSKPGVLEEISALPKSQRRAFMAKPGAWNAYSSVRGVSERARVSKENPPGAVRGIVADYDAPTSPEEVIRLLSKIKQAEFRPNYIERSLSNNVRLVWVFEKEVLVSDHDFCTRLLQTFLEKLKARALLAGYDEKSGAPEQVWTNGVSWTVLNEKPMPWATVFGLVCEVSEKMDRGDTEIPYDVIYAEIENRWPGRWRGPFDLDQIGVRFWDNRADNPAGCRVKPDGMQCFSGHVGFMKWEAIFGAAWCDAQRALNLGRAAGETYFDSKSYWQQRIERWASLNREDVILSLKIKEISAKARKGRVSSDVERVLNYIQTVNRIDGAAPIVNRKPGITFLDGQRILNTSTIRALPPCAELNVTVDHFPTVWGLLNPMFDPEALNHWLSWMQRFYNAVYNYQPLMGQAVFLCGPKNCGKTLLAYRIIKPLVGDRAANPYDYFTGQTQFNSELFESPLLMINDEEAISNMQVRLKFLARLKSFVVNPAHMYHRKFGSPFSVEWTGRLFATLNDDPDSVGILPEVNSNTSDKISFFRALERRGNWEDNHILEAKIAAELPFFARFLLEWKPPEGIVIGGRMGVKSYFDKHILETAIQQNAHYRMVETLRAWIDLSPYWHEPKTTEWIGDPTRFFVELSSLETIASAMRDQNPAKCANSLDALARIPESGVERLIASERLFKITKSLVRRNDNPAARANEPADI